jgi:Fe2+ transport system protein B
MTLSEPVVTSTIALAGNPNAGKTTLFNALTGSRQHVGNYPGITVEKKEGYVNTHQGVTRVVDLPGTYSLTAYSQEELVARDFLIHERPQSVINVLDATSLERNLYLTVQFLELGIPVTLALKWSTPSKPRACASTKPGWRASCACPWSAPWPAMARACAKPWTRR